MSNEDYKVIDMIYPIDEWQFIIGTNGKPESFLRVGIENQEYKAIMFGGDARFFAGGINKFKNDFKSDPILVLDGMKYYFVYEGPKGQEKIMAIPSPHETDKGHQLKYIENKYFREGIKHRVENYQHGMRTGVSINQESNIELFNEYSSKKHFKAYLLLSFAILSILMYVIKYKN